MARKLVFALSIVTSMVLLISAQRAQAISYPDLQLSSTATVTDYRVMVGASKPLGLGSLVVTTGGATNSESYSLSGDILTVSPASGTVKKGASAGKTIPFKYIWSNVSGTGARTGEITLSTTEGTTYSTESFDVDGAVLKNRPLTAASLPSRVLLGAALTTTLSSGTSSADDDADATRVNTVLSGVATKGGLSFSYAASSLSQFNGVDQTATLNVSPGKGAGLYAGTIDLSKALLSNGEAKSVGAKVQPVDLTYSVAVVQQRQLVVGTTAARIVDSGTRAVTTTMTLGTGKKGLDDNHATRIDVSSSAVVSLGTGVSLQYYGGPTQLNGKNQTDTLDVSFAGLGLYTDSGAPINLATTSLLSNGEAFSVGLLAENLTYSTAVVANRQLHVNAPSLGTPGAVSDAVRTLISTSLTGTISTGDNPLVDGANYATYLNATTKGKVVDSTKNVTVTVASNATFSGTGQSDGLKIAFGKTPGNYQGTLNLASTAKSSLITNGEAKGVTGVVIQPADLSYNVDVLAPRKLKAVSGNADATGLLSGATLPASELGVYTTNKTGDADYQATRVNVAGTTFSAGGLNFSSATTLVDAGGTIAIPITVTGYTAGTVSVVRQPYSLAVTTAETSFKDTSSYASVTGKLTYNVTDVGVATLGVTTTAGPTFGAPLSASIVPGGKAGGLSSEVNPIGTLASNSLAGSLVLTDSSLTSPASPAGVYGPVGSKAAILNSTATSSSGTTVTMQWRARTAAEAHVGGAVAPGLAAAGAKWLTSDVVDVQGVDDLSYVLQMSFDPRINLTFDGQVQGQTSRELAGLFIATDESGTWVRTANEDAPYVGSYASYLTSLDEPTTYIPPVGTWGVDPTTNLSWEVVHGSGTFAVVPEPSTLLLLITAGLALLGYGVRRWRS